LIDRLVTGRLVACAVHDGIYRPPPDVGVAEKQHTAVRHQIRRQRPVRAEVRSGHDRRPAGWVTPLQCEQVRLTPCNGHHRSDRLRVHIPASQPRKTVPSNAGTSR